MSADINLLSLFLGSRETFDRFESSIPHHLLEDETRLVLADLKLWYEQHPNDTAVSTDRVWELWEWMKLTRHSNLSADKLGLIKRLIGRAMQAKVTTKANEILRTLTLRDHAAKIAGKADKFAAGDTSFNLFDELLDDVEVARRDAGLHNDHELEVMVPFSDIVAELGDPGTGLNWRSPNMNMAVGPIRKGNLLVVAAFVDSGKSTFASSELTFMATQLEGSEKAILFNNEEDGKVVKLRLLMSATGRSLDDIKADVKDAVQDYTRRMNGDPQRIVVVDSPRISTGIVRRKLRQYNTKLIVFDQLHKLKGFKMHGEDKLGHLQDIFEYARGLAKEYCPVIAIHQARGDANGVEYIEMHQLAGSQQAIQGESDVIVTIGRNLEVPNARYIYVPKNKLPTPGDPTARNLKVEVWPKFNIGRFDE